MRTSVAASGPGTALAWHDPPMADLPWTGDACSLVDAFRAGERSPVEELGATLSAISSSDLNAFSFVDDERALDAARAADVQRPFGGVPAGIKELESVRGWPATEASLVFRDRVADTTSRLRRTAARSGRRRRVSVSRPPASSAASTSARRSSTASRTTRGSTVARPADRRPGARRRSRAGWSRSRPVATVAVPSASRPATPACSA